MVSGSSGSDRVDGGNGDDNLFGGDGIDRIIGGSGEDTLFQTGFRDDFRITRPDSLVRIFDLRDPDTTFDEEGTNVLEDDVEMVLFAEEVEFGLRLISVDDLLG